MLQLHIRHNSLLLIAISLARACIPFKAHHIEADHLVDVHIYLARVSRTPYSRARERGTGRAHFHPVSYKTTDMFTSWIYNRLLFAPLGSRDCRSVAPRRRERGALVAAPCLCRARIRRYDICVWI